MINQIEQETHEFGFFQAVSLLEKHYPVSYTHLTLPTIFRV